MSAIDPLNVNRESAVPSPVVKLNPVTAASVIVPLSGVSVTLRLAASTSSTANPEIVNGVSSVAATGNGGEAKGGSFTGFTVTLNMTGVETLPSGSLAVTVTIVVPEASILG